MVLQFPNSFFIDENIHLLREFKSKIEAVDYVFNINSPLDATVIINQDDILSIQTYDEALKNNYIQTLDQYESVFTASPYYKKLLSEDYTYVGLSVSINKENDGSDLMRRVGAIEGFLVD